LIALFKREISTPTSPIETTEASNKASSREATLNSSPSIRIVSVKKESFA